MKNIPSNISRRGFIVGGSALLGTSILGLSACGASTDTSSKDNVSNITAATAYQTTDFNPIGATTALSMGCHLHVFEGLYEMDYHTFKPYNALATSEPVQVDSTTYDVTIRDDAKFSNGQDVTIEDVINAFEKNLQVDTYKGFLSFIDSMQKVGPKTIRFLLKYPYDLLTSRLCTVKIFPMKLSTDELKKMPIGTGPYLYTSINGVDGGKVELEKNQYYNGAHPALTETLTFNVLMDDTSRQLSLCEKTSQVIEAVPRDAVGVCENAGSQIDYVQSMSCCNLLFNTLKAPFDDERVRQAFFYAINYEKMIYNCFEGHASSPSCLLPEGSEYHHKCSTVYEYNPEKSMQLLKEAGHDEISVTLLSDKTWVKDLTAQIQQDLKAVGINATLKIETLKWATLAASSDESSFDVILQAGDPSVFGNDPDMIMSFWFTDNIWTKQRTGYQKAENSKWPRINDLILQARKLTGQQQRDTWNQALDLIAESATQYPIVHRQIATGYWPEQLENFSPISTTGVDLVSVSRKA